MYIALYLRLSLADGDLGKDGKDESNSIDNQRLLLENFAKSREDMDPEQTGYQLREYIDDGYTGTNFNRPAFRQMIEDCKKGQIKIILVKDLSRLGRDYIGVGDYLEQIFPVMGIRFIAVNSNYDSANHEGTTMGLEMSVNNLINNLYSKDLSKKLVSAYRAKWKQGIPTLGRVPFGYRRKNGSTEWQVDPEASKIVRLIFEKAMAGWDTTMIARFLNQEGYPTPGQYVEWKQKTFKVQRNVYDKEWLWVHDTVWRILKRTAYTGCVVQGQRRIIKPGSHITRKSGSDEVVIIPNHHEAIVTEEEWEKAQNAIHTQSSHAMPQPTGFSLNGKIKCGNCGLALTYDGHGIPTLQCAHGACLGEQSKCDKTRYIAGQIEVGVLRVLQKELSVFHAFQKIIEEKQDSKGADLKKKAREMNQELKNLTARKLLLYESYVDGHLEKEKYIRQKEEMTDQIDRLKQQYDTVSELLQSDRQLETDVRRLAEDSASLEGFRYLTKEIVQEFIEKVVVYDAFHMEITFTFEDVLQKVMERMEAGRRQDGKAANGTE